MDAIADIAVFVAFAVAVVIGICIYLLPAIIAAYRGHPHWLTLAIVNFMTGWTGLGWIATAVWSFVTPRGTKQQSFHG